MANTYKILRTNGGYYGFLRVGGCYEDDGRKKTLATIDGYDYRIRADCLNNSVGWFVL